jgi:hypothetical protein
MEILSIWGLMKWIPALILLSLLAACATMRAIDGSPAQLQQLIDAGKLLEPGQRVRIVTSDEKTHSFKITGIDAGLIVGSNDAVSVDQIQYLEIQQFQKMTCPVSFTFDREIAFDSLIAIAAFALRPNSINAAP